MLKRILYTAAFGTTIYLIYEEIYRKSIEIKKMTKKLKNLYANITENEPISDDINATHLKPNNIDELTNLVSLAHRYHYKIVVGTDHPKKEKIAISEQSNGKCLFIDLSKLKNVSIN